MSGLANEIKIITKGSLEYPNRLREIPSAPAQLYYAGDISLLKRESVAVVGSRKYTMYGKNVALMIGRRLAECGVPVVSGLAYGIDAFAHQGALENGGRIIGVLASGILKMTPRRNHDLMMKGLEAGGLVVSEYPPDEDAMPYTFPLRNRIISGLGTRTVVVEANFNSGALITAQYSIDQGRQVYAVPGNINSQFSMGSNLLIRDGATPLVIIDDVIRDLGIDPHERKTASEELRPDEMLVYEAVSRNDGITPDMIAGETGMKIALVCSITTVLEIKGLVETCGGKIYLAK